MKGIKRSNFIVAGSVIVALIFWITDTLIDYSVEHSGSFTTSLLSDSHELAFRSLASLFFIMYGIFMARTFSKRKRTEEELREAENYLQTIIETEPECVKLVSRDGRLMRMNRAGLAMLEADSFEQVMGRPLSDAIAPQYRQAFKELTERTFEGESGTMEFEMVGLKGKRLWLETHAVPLRNAKGEIFASLGITRDITGRKHADEQIMAALREKDILLKEIHHRVKNNLQVVASMLELQAEYIEDNEAKRFFEESQKRVETMSLIHEKLYRSEDLARIDFGEYVDDLTANLFTLHTGESRHIGFSIDIPGILLDVNKAIPCGLILNELISNVLKHAFTDGRKGMLGVSMSKNDEGRITLAVSDNGIGFPENVDFRNTKSLGLQLVVSLVRQLNGTIELERDNGTMFKVNFQGVNARSGLDHG